MNKVRKESPAKNNYQYIIKFILSISLCLLVGAIAAYFTQSSVNTWYTTLQKPSFNPPNWIFAPVWTTLYCLMGISLFLTWNKGNNNTQRQTAIGLFLAQLFFNGLWSFAFFMMQSPLAGLVVISILFLLIVLTILTFFRISGWAAVLLFPYLLWVGFASILNYTIFILNNN